MIGSKRLVWRFQIDVVLAGRVVGKVLMLFAFLTNTLQRIHRQKRSQYQGAALIKLLFTAGKVVGIVNRVGR